MTYPVPDRLAPVRVQVRRRTLGVTVLAVLAAVLAFFAGLGAHVGRVSSFDLACFALAALALHFAWTVPVPGRRV